MAQTQLSDLEEKVRSFCEARNWGSFHSIKNLAIGAVTEASELVEPFRFLTDDESQKFIETPEGRVAVEDEMADVFFFLLRISQRQGIDLAGALERKLVKNAIKYPAPKALHNP
jgi:NTP pyrophosphatase (non-canonical NTP hydrolase)